MVLFHEDAKNKLKEGIEVLYKAVSATLGPGGRTVIIQGEWEDPIVTKDGVTVAKHVTVEDKQAYQGVILARQAAEKTNDMVGDATTTSIVLTWELIKEGTKMVAAGANPVELKRGMDLALKAVVGELKKMSEPIQKDDYTRIEQVATVSANNDSETGALIADALKRVGIDGLVYADVAKGNETYIEETKGMLFDKGYTSSHFATNQEKSAAEYEDVAVVLYDGKLVSTEDLATIMQTVNRLQKPVLIFAEDYDPNLNALLIANKLRNGFKVVPVRSPGYMERRKRMLEDIACVTGATIISEEIGNKAEDFTPEWVGYVDKIVVKTNSTLLIGGKGNPQDIQDRIAEIKHLIEVETGSWERDKLTERLAKLAGGVAVIYVGANTEAEMGEKKDRVVDALCATKAAVEEGILPGGGTALLKVQQNTEVGGFENKDQEIGANVLWNALSSPIKTIAENCGISGEVVAAEVIRSQKGYNARTGVYEDLKEAGIIDPLKVVRIALENAVSVAGTILTVECLVGRKEIKE